VLLYNHCCRGNVISITYSECVSVNLVIQHAKRMRSIILSSLACMALKYFSTLSHKRRNIRKKNIEHKICVLHISKNVLIKSSLLYGSETWRLIENNKRRVEATEMDALRRSSRTVMGKLFYERAKKILAGRNYLL